MNLNFKPAHRIAADGSLLPGKGRRSLLIVSTVSWLSLGFLGLWFLWGYENTPGIAAESPRVAERLTPLRPHMKVLYMSGYTDDAIVHHGVLEAGTAFIAKPFSIDGLARKLREVLDEPVAA